MSNSSLLIDDIWEVKQIDTDGKKFDKVSRIECKSENYEMDMILDVNTDIYPIEVNDKLIIALSTSISLDNSTQSHPATFDRKLGTSQKPSLMDNYDYVMYGKIYKHKTDKSKELKVSVYASFGGLLMRLTGDSRNMQNMDPDMYLYLLMRKSK